jgi:hypothetical protein
MRRRLFAVAFAISLLLFLATAVIWVRSYWWEDFLERSRFEPSRQTRRDDLIMSWKGGLGIFVTHETISPTEFIYPLEGDYLMAKGDITLPWAYHRRKLNSGMILDTARHAEWWQAIIISSDRDSVTQKTPSKLTISIAHRYSTVQLKFWAIAAVFLILPVQRGARVLTRSLRRIIRTAHNRCPRCSYSLTGNTSGVCPECGQPIVRALDGVDTVSRAPEPR